MSLSPEALVELLAVCDFVERSTNLDPEIIYTCEDRHGTHSVRVSVLRALVAAVMP